jgi:hypothetical protein
MGPAAHVTESGALVDFQAKLCTFAGEAKEALDIIDHEIRRTFSFLDERLRQWQTATRRAEDELIQAKIEWNRSRNQRIGERRPDASFQEKLLQRAQAKLDFAQRQLAAAERWQRDLPRELLQYEGPARRLQNALDGELPRASAFLEAKIAALETYAQRSQP